MLRTRSISVIQQKITGIFLIFAVLAGCANYGDPRNLEITDVRATDRYALSDWEEGQSASDLSLFLTFSGGGTRAAALSYGVLQELRDTDIEIGGRTTRMLDEVDHISSVSGGSFTSAYYGLYGDGLFENFEREFLRFNLEKHLYRKAINPALLFSEKGRTESAIEYYQEVLFHDATFADMIQPDRPMIIINASDLGYGIRFSFIQEYFDLLCSDLTSFPVAQAVAASSAVPVLFNPVVLENYDTCSDMQLTGTSRVRERIEAVDEGNIPVMLAQLDSYSEKEKRRYIHFVDGGVTDNLGLRAIFDIIMVAGGIDEFVKKQNKPVSRHIVVVMVDADTGPNTNMNQSTRQPSTASVISAVSGLQLARYDAESIRLVKHKMAQWAARSTPEIPLKAHFISVSFQDIRQADTLEFINKIPTSFNLSDEQVDTLIEAGRRLLRDNPAFQKLLSDLANPS
jgi:NTE family protein